MGEPAKIITFKPSTLATCVKVSIKNSEDFFPIYPGLLSLLEADKLNFGVWILGSEYILEFINPGFVVDQKIERLKNLTDSLSKFQSKSKILIRNEDREKFKQHILEARTQGLRKSVKASIVTKTYLSICQCSDSLHGEFNLHTMREAEQISTAAVASVSKNKNLLKTLIELLDNNQKMYEHTAFVTLVSTSIGHKLGFADEHLKVLAIGAMYHDIGMNRIDITNRFTHNVNPKELKKYERHPQEGVALLEEICTKENIEVPNEVFTIILQHHENYNGTGFPNHLKGRLSAQDPDGIHIFASIVRLADHFSYYFLHLEDKPKFSKLAALRALNRLEKMFDPKVIATFNNIMDYKAETVRYTEGDVKLTK